MQDFLLMLVMLATFIFGWFLMDKVDDFLENGKDRRQYPDSSVCLFQEDREVLLKKGQYML